MHCSALQCTVLLYSALFCVTVHCSMVCCTVLRYSAVFRTSLQQSPVGEQPLTISKKWCPAGQLRTIRFTALHCTTIALTCTARHCKILYCTALHCTALHWMELRWNRGKKKIMHCLSRLSVAFFFFLQFLLQFYYVINQK